MNLYYEVMHKIEFSIFSSGYIKAKTKSLNKDLLKNLKEFFNIESSVKWEIILENDKNIQSLFDKLVLRAKESEDWKMITKHFPDAVLKDIII